MGIFCSNKVSDDDDTLIMTCSCVGGDIELDHAVTFTLANLRFENGGEMPEAYVFVNLHSSPNTFWKRLKLGVRYIFGYECRYGHYMETLIDPKDAQALREFFDKYLQAWTKFEFLNRKKK